MIERLTFQISELEEETQSLTERNDDLNNRNDILAKELNSASEEVSLFLWLLVLVELHKPQRLTYVIVACGS